MTSSSFSSPPQSSPARGEIVDPESASETKESSHITRRPMTPARRKRIIRSEEHTSELQSRGHLVCRLLLEKKKEIFITIVVVNQVTIHSSWKSLHIKM